MRDQLRILAMLCAFALSVTLARAQPPPPFTANSVLTAAALNAALAAKANAAQFPMANLVADGVTSDDVALKAAVAVCSSTGGWLFLPAGKIALTGAAGTINPSNCKIIGTGFPGGTVGAPFSWGTTFIITNTTTPVFTGGALSNNTGGSGFSMEGFGAYWPNQTGNTVYPPFFTDLGNAQVNGAYIHNIQLINCYQCFLQAANSDWWNWAISDSSIYGVLDGFNVYSTCESWRMSNVHFTAGLWTLAFASGSTSPTYAVNGYINIADAQNAMIHVPHTSACGVTVVATNITSFAWRYAVLVDDGGRFINSPFSGSLDGVGTFLKLNGTGTAQGSTFSGSGWVSCVEHFPTSGIDTFGCSPGASSAPAAFDLGVGGAPIIKSYQGGGQGSFITSGGAGMVIEGADVSFGNHNNGTFDTTDYYCAHTTANTGGTGLVAQNMHCSPAGTTGTKMHGIVADAALNLFTVQGLDISNANEAVSTPTGGTITLTGITARTTTGSVSMVLPGTGEVLYHGNNVDKPAKATLTAGCGGAGSSVTGGIRGSFTPDNTSANTCDLTLPWVPYGGTGNCSFFPRQASALNAFRSATKTWTVTIVSGTATFGSIPISFDCSGIQ